MELGYKSILLALLNLLSYISLPHLFGKLPPPYIDPFSIADTNSALRPGMSYQLLRPEHVEGMLNLKGSRETVSHLIHVVNMVSQMGT
jgi:hypothetical protein